MDFVYLSDVYCGRKSEYPQKQLQTWGEHAKPSVQLGFKPWTFSFCIFLINNILMGSSAEVSSICVREYIRYVLYIV